ncbi:hypothetical protein, partial [Agriterribacter sp.]|uniref:hypothetical protein n=1 Tax=Agriterribacter sp. TaxID=2821509 RepID=UPI002C81BC5F
MNPKSEGKTPKAKSQKANRYRWFAPHRGGQAHHDRQISNTKSEAGNPKSEANPNGCIPNFRFAYFPARETRAGAVAV